MAIVSPQLEYENLAREKLYPGYCAVLGCVFVKQKIRVKFVVIAIFLFKYIVSFKIKKTLRKMQ